VVTVPTTVVEEMPAQTEEAAVRAAPQPKTSSPRDPLLFDAPPATAVAVTAEQTEEKLRAIRDGYLLREREEPPKRPLPWFLDIFLYPVNKLGLMIPLFCAGVPFVLRPALMWSCELTKVFMPGLFLWVPLMFAHWGALLLGLLYINWYLAECIRDSAGGGIRAADTTGSTPGLAELFGQSLAMLACGAACLGPSIVYGGSHGEGTVYWVLYGAGGFLFPMALLAVTQFETLRALNPLLLLPSILSTLLPYCLLAAFCYAFCRLPDLAIRRLFTSESWVSGYVLLFAAFYLSLVLAHLLGRFHWRYAQRLNWDA
jgi:hypothetical protein